MSSTQQNQPRKQLWVAWCPDYPDALPRRRAVRADHLSGVNGAFESGALRIAGYMTAPDSVGKPPAEQEINGSTMIFEADTIDEVRRKIEADPYWDGNVWDKEKVDIRPIFMAAATPPGRV